MARGRRLAGGPQQGCGTSVLPGPVYGPAGSAPVWRQLVVGRAALETAGRREEEKEEEAREEEEARQGGGEGGRRVSDTPDVTTESNPAPPRRRWKRFLPPPETFRWSALLAAARSDLRRPRRGWASSLLPRTIDLLYSLVACLLFWSRADFPRYVRCMLGVDTDPSLTVRPSADPLPSPLVPLNSRARQRGWGPSVSNASTRVIIILNLLLLALNFLYAPDVLFPLDPTPIQVSATDDLVHRVETYLSVVAPWAKPVRPPSLQKQSPLEELLSCGITVGYEDEGTVARALIADRVALPRKAVSCDPTSLVGPEVADFFGKEANVVRPQTKEVVDNAGRYFKANPLQWAKLIVRTIRLRLVSLWPRHLVRAVNGAFGREKPDGDQRFLFDGREVNVQHSPSWDYGSNTPGTLCLLQCSPTNPLYITKADVRSYFFEPKAFRWLIPWLAMPPVHEGPLTAAGLTRSEFLAALGPSRVPQPPKPNVPFRFRCGPQWFPCFNAWPMGYKHSPLVAQRTHEGVVFKYTSLSRENMLTDKSAVPDSSEYLSIICDDLIILTRAHQRGVDLDKELDEGYRQAGLDRHEGKKVVSSLRTDVIGMILDGEGSLLPKGEKFWLMIMGTVELLARVLIAPHVVSRLLGLWTWNLMVWRPGLSVLGAVYEFVESQSKAPRYIPSKVHHELFLLVCLAPMVWSDLTRGWDDLLGAVDASTTGFGGVYARFTSNYIQRLGGLSEKRGDYVTMHEDSPDTDSSDGDDHGEWRPWFPNKRILGSPHFIPLNAGDFNIHLKGRWRFEEHINSLELKTILLHVRWLSRQRVRHLRRHVVLSDNKITVCVIGKGRSSSYRLRRTLQRLAALLAYCGISLHVLWVPTACNPADGPSRGRGISLPSSTIGTRLSDPVRAFLGRFYIASRGYCEVLSSHGRLAWGHLRAGVSCSIASSVKAGVMVFASSVPSSFFVM